jgi:hypothetical protein
MTGGATRRRPAAPHRAPLAGRLVAGGQEALVRRGPNRLTAQEIAQAARLPRPAVPAGSSPERIELTDASGVAVFPGLPAGEYHLELEGMEP